MPTQEQRLTTLERSQIETNEQFAILLGVIGEQGRDIKKLVQQGDEHTQLLKRITRLLEERT